MKYFFYFILGILAIALLILLGYFFRYKGGGSSDTAPGATSSSPLSFPLSPAGTPAGTPAGGAPQTSTMPVVQLSPEEKFGLVSPYPVGDYFISPSGTIAIIQPDGQVIKIEAGNASVLSSTLVASLLSAAFSYDGKLILASFGEPSDLQTSVFDAARKSWRPLPAGIRGAAWAPDSNSIAYFTARGSRDVLETLDLGNSKAQPREMVSLSAYDLMPKWTVPGQIFLEGKPSALIPSSLLRFDAKKRTLSFIARDKLGLETIWDKKGARGLSFAAGANQRGGLLSLLDAQGQALRQLSVATLPSKCVFGESTATSSAASASSTMLYCAVPRDSQEFGRSQLPDAYEKRILFTEDGIRSINLQSGAQKTLWNEQSVALDATRLKIFGGRLYFINRLDQKLYSLSLADAAGN